MDQNLPEAKADVKTSKFSNKKLIIVLAVLFVFVLLMSVIGALFLTKPEFLFGKQSKDDVDDQEQEEGIKKCTYDGKEYEVGEGFPATDGCNLCSCTEDGVVCTLIACEANKKSHELLLEPEDWSTNKKVEFDFVAEKDAVVKTDSFKNPESGETFDTGIQISGADYILKLYMDYEGEGVMLSSQEEVVEVSVDKSLASERKVYRNLGGGNYYADLKTKSEECADLASAYNVENTGRCAGSDVMGEILMEISCSANNKSGNNTTNVKKCDDILSSMTIKSLEKR